MRTTQTTAAPRPNTEPMPGCYRVGKLSNGHTAIYSKRGLIAAMESGSQATRESDAAEIVLRYNAAPKLLSALQGLLEKWDILHEDATRHGLGDCLACSNARAAIAKATGGE